MALLSDMEKTRVIFYSKNIVTKADTVNYTPTGMAYFTTLKEVLTYFIDNTISIDLTMDSKLTELQKKYKGGLHHPGGPLESTHDIRWLINQYYND